MRIKSHSCSPANEVHLTAAELHSEAFCSFKVLSRDSSLALINTGDNMSPNLNAKILILCLFTFSLSVVLA